MKTILGRRPCLYVMPVALSLVIATTSCSPAGFLSAVAGLGSRRSDTQPIQVSVKLNVLDARTSQELDPIRVEVDDPDATQDASGTEWFFDKAGSYSITVSARDYKPMTKTVNVTARGTRATYLLQPEVAERAGSGEPVLAPPEPTPSSGATSLPPEPLPPPRHNSAASHLAINAEPTPYSLVKGELVRYSFSVTRGKNYKLLQRTQAGSGCWYMGKQPIVDADNHETPRSSCDTDFEFKAEESRTLYLAMIADKEDKDGYEGTIRVISSDEQLSRVAPTGGTISINGKPLSYSLVKGETKRYRFSVSRGQKYKLTQKTTAGSGCWYISKNSSVDADNHDTPRSSCDTDFEFKADESATFYLAVIADKDDSAGYEGTIQITTISGEE